MVVLDIDTLIVTTAVVTLLTALLLATFAKVVPSGIHGHKLWVFSFLLYSVSTWLGSGHEVVPLLVARYGAAVIEALAGCLLYAGVCQFFKRPIPRQLIAGFIIFELGILSASLISSDGDRLLWLALIVARGLLPLGIAVVAWTSRNRQRWISGATLGATAAFAQCIVVLLYGASEASPLLASGLGFNQQAFQITEMGLAIVGTVAMIHVVNDRIRDDLEYLASHDALTGALTRRTFDEHYTKELARASRNSRYPSLLMVDIDNFKAINDSHGHAVGDRALQAVCNAMVNALRQEDLLGRFGGEEFLAMLPDTQAAAAFEVAERVRRGIEALEMTDGAPPFSCTVSIGVAQCKPSLAPEAAIRAADDAMYRAKAAGKNCVAMAD